MTVRTTGLGYLLDAGVIKTENIMGHSPLGGVLIHGKTSGGDYFQVLVDAQLVYVGEVASDE